MIRFVLTFCLVAIAQLSSAATEIELDLPGKEGATYLMAGLLEEGAGDLSATEFLEATENLAASYSYRTFRDSVSIEAEMLKENMDEAIDLLRLALIEPTFGQVAIDRVKSQIMSSLEQDKTDPDEIASSTLRALSFAGHPYGTKDEGSLETLGQLERDDIVTAHQNALVKSRMYVGVVGDRLLFRVPFERDIGRKWC